MTLDTRSLHTEQSLPCLQREFYLCWSLYISEEVFSFLSPTLICRHNPSAPFTSSPVTDPAPLPVFLCCLCSAHTQRPVFLSIYPVKRVTLQRGSWRFRLEYFHGIGEHQAAQRKGSPVLKVTHILRGALMDCGKHAGVVKALYDSKEGAQALGA